MADSLSNFLDSYLINLFKVMKCGNYNETLFNSKRHEILRINDICKGLFASDNKIKLIDNQSENLCPHYPPIIVIPNQSVTYNNESLAVMVQRDDALIQNIYKSTQARCRNRFVVPIIHFNDKFICRSSTLSGTFEMYGRQYLGTVFGGSTVSSGSTGKETFDKIRGDDKNLLDNLNVRYIFDLMLENKKMMFGLPMSSSEKIDRHNRYKEFNIISLPYPGCEFFNEWRESNYKMCNMFFNWDHHEITSKLQVQLSITPLMVSQVDWKDYTQWDLIELTNNYLKLMLGIIIEDSFSILIHCISGWDRTPLFISLLRCLLWSEGLLHQSLTANQMLYLTLAYDWFLFGHQTKSRLKTGEEILKFTFHYLRHVSQDHSMSVSYIYGDLNVTKQWENVPPDLLRKDKYLINDRLEQRQQKLEDIALTFDKIYDQELSHIVSKSATKGSKSFMYSASSLVNGLLSPFTNSDSSSVSK